jgi:hypothetical protein
MHDAVLTPGLGSLVALGSPANFDRAVEKPEADMPRNVGDRYVCDKCGAALVYEKGCPCPESMPHSELCCGQQMKAVSKNAPPAKK